MRSFTSGGNVRTATAIALLLAVLAGVAWAHATLVRSTPSANAHVARPPAELRLEFNEAVTVRTSRIELMGPDSQRMQLTLRSDIANTKVMMADVPPLSIAGSYRVEWRLVGPDGHAVTGRYAFTIDSIPVLPSADTIPAEAAAGQPDLHEPDTDSLFQQALRFVAVLSMVIIIGAIAFALFVVPAATQSDSGAIAEFRLRMDHGLRSLALVGAWSLLVLAVIRVVSHGIVLSGSLGALRANEVADLITGTTFGRGVLLQVAATVTLLFGLRAAMPRWSALAGVAVALAISAPFLGHPAAVPDVRFLAMSIDAVHVLAAGGWAGAILMLSIVALPNVSVVRANGRIDVVRDLLRAFSPLALWCAAGVAVTGLLGGWLELRDLGLVLESDYGRMLVRKIVVVLVIALLGAYHWRGVQPAMANEGSVARLRISLALDVALVLLVLLITAFLTGTAPPIR